MSSSTNRKLSRKKIPILIVTIAIVAFFLLFPLILVEVVVKNDGTWNPGTSYQRYRAAEYPADKNFFQWWYFSLKDYDLGETFAFTYALSRPATNQTYRGSYVMMAYVSNATRFHIYYRFPLESLLVTGDCNLSINGTTFTQEAFTSNHIRIQGRMNQSANLWVAEGISPDTNITWNLDIYRIAGWYGQQDIEGLVKLTEVIAWNTYSYDSEVNGSVTINGTSYLISRSPRFRIYCDMNWGKNFPRGDPSIDFMWGWYYTGVPNANTTQDFAMIAGVGRSVCSISVVSPMYAKFASMYNRGERLGVKFGQLLDLAEDSGVPLVHKASDGNCIDFHVDRTDWVNLTDAFGTARIPLTQVVTIETTTRKVVMTFHSAAHNYNRLLFPTDGYIFSDFEGLSVNCTTDIYAKTYPSWDLAKVYPITTLEETLNDVNGGIEFGYQVEMSL